MIRSVDAPALLQCCPDVETARSRDVDVFRSRLPEHVRNVYQSQQTMVSDSIRHHNGNAENGQVRLRKMRHFWDRGDGGYYRPSYFLSDSVTSPSTGGEVNALHNTKTVSRSESVSTHVSTDMPDNASCRHQHGVRGVISRLLALPQYVWRKMCCCFGRATPVRDAASDSLSCASVWSTSLEEVDRVSLHGASATISCSSDSGMAASSWSPPVTRRDVDKTLSRTEASHSNDSLLSCSTQRQQPYDQPISGDNSPEVTMDELFSRFEMYPPQYKHPQEPVSEFALNPPDSLRSRFIQRQREHARHRIGRDQPLASTADECKIYPVQRDYHGKMVKMALWGNQAPRVSLAR
jgi:hypothetical protein